VGRNVEAGKTETVEIRVAQRLLDGFNGTASHALDYDDFSQPMGGHQFAPLVAPLLAVAEERHLSGAQLIQSYVVGVETEIRLARSVNFHHYDKGWHPTATIGVFGAAAAVGHMIGLDAAKPSAAQGKGNTLLETSWVP
jgi:2-methylcitrate dehydratase PrpD